MVKILFIATISLASIDIDAYGYNFNRGHVASDIYGDTPPLWYAPIVTLDLTTKSTNLGSQSKDKSIGENFGNFAKASLTPFVWNWTERLLLAPHNVSEVAAQFPLGWLRNISGWQECKLIYCSRTHQKSSFFSPPFNDGDPFHINYIEHPVSGAATYLFYRADGFDRLSAFVGSFIQSFLFEYTMEGFQQPPSLNDIVVTPMIGTAIGLMVEESAEWLSQRDSPFLRSMSYVVNPFRLLKLGRDVSFQNVAGFSVRFNWY